jgi:hypothetical protein
VQKPDQCESRGLSAGNACLWLVLKRILGFDGKRLSRPAESAAATVSIIDTRRVSAVSCVKGGRRVMNVRIHDVGLSFIRMAESAPMVMRQVWN